MKIGFIGCVESSQVALEALLASEEKDYQVVGVITKKSSPFNTDFIIKPRLSFRTILFNAANKYCRER
jgi:hypothetical protein